MVYIMRFLLFWGIPSYRTNNYGHFSTIYAKSSKTTGTKKKLGSHTDGSDCTTLKAVYRSCGALTGIKKRKF